MVGQGGRSGREVRVAGQDGRPGRDARVEGPGGGPGWKARVEVPNKKRLENRETKMQKKGSNNSQSRGMRKVGKSRGRKPTSELRKSKDKMAGKMETGPDKPNL